MIFFGGFPPAGGLLPGARCQLVTGLSFSGNRLSLLVTRVADSIRQASYHCTTANTSEVYMGASSAERQLWMNILMPITHLRAECFN